MPWLSASTRPGKLGSWWAEKLHPRGWTGADTGSRGALVSEVYSHVPNKILKHPLNSWPQECEVNAASISEGWPDLLVIPILPRQQNEGRGDSWFTPAFLLISARSQLQPTVMPASDWTVIFCHTPRICPGAATTNTENWSESFRSEENISIRKDTTAKDAKKVL